MLHVLAGLATGLSLIIAIGAQNAYVLRQGLRRSHVGAVVAICAASDVVLILAGVTGIGAIVDRAPWAIEVVRWLGVAFLTWYGLSSLLRARHAGTLGADGQVAEERRTAVVRAVALTWLNPHVYLDTVLLLGSIAGTHGASGRWWFALGACVGSVVWFTGLGFGARLLAPLLARPRAWQVLDVLIGLVMLAIAARLALG
ncbi:MAG: LysE/ArgO family amino acid transporter [Nocardioides sp.]|nr:LysE/ArgO family amino acid transporter [Nocardioides sp.]